MIRRLFTVVSVLSLLVCLAAAGVWCASYRWPGQWVSGSNPGVRWMVTSDKGWLMVERLEIVFWPNFRGGNLWSMESANKPPGWHSPGLHVARRRGVVRNRLPGETRPPFLPALEQQIKSPRIPWNYQCEVRVAYPLVCGVSAVLPALWLWRTLARRRRRRSGPGFEPVTMTAAAAPSPAAVGTAGM